MSEEDYFKYYIQGSDHYLIPRDIFEELFNEMNNWKNEYKRREKKWEKWATEKGILSSKMGEYLCKYQNIKREYANQNKFLCEYKKENQQLKNDNAVMKANLIQVSDKQRDLYKEVIEEVRKYIDIHKKWVKNDDEMVEPILDGYNIRDLLQILDKAKGEDNG